MDDLTRIVEAKASSWSEADKVLAETIAIDIADLTQRSISGATVPPEEWALAKAAVKNLGAGAAVDGAAVFREWLGLVFSGLSSAIL